MIETIMLASIWHYIYGILLSGTAIFLILLVLVQRGRGGGLAGAFGGMGGQSAFGTKAGDTFTKVTIGVSIFWIILCLASVKFLGTNSGSFGQAMPPEETQVGPLGPGSDETSLPPLGTSPDGPVGPGEGGEAPPADPAPAPEEE